MVVSLLTIYNGVASQITAFAIVYYNRVQKCFRKHLLTYLLQYCPHFLISSPHSPISMLVILMTPVHATHAEIAFFNIDIG